MSRLIQDKTLLQIIFVQYEQHRNRSALYFIKSLGWGGKYYKQTHMNETRKALVFYNQRKAVSHFNILFPVLYIFR